MSVSTAGAVDFRSDKERIARKTAKGARAAKKQNRLLGQQIDAIKDQTAALTAAAAAAKAAETAVAPAAVVQPTPPPQSVPAGWYPDPHGEPSLLRWFDGGAWTDHTHRIDAPPPPPT
ncbi:DUF2510 domain-containing protein [Gordonia terrae]